MNDVTYATLDKVLHSRGFTCRLLRDEPPARWYKHPETGAVIALPLLPESAFASSLDLFAVRSTFKVYGLGDPLELVAGAPKAG